MTQQATDEPRENLRPELPDFGCYLRWPQDDDDWIHPEDLEVAKELIPSRRVLKRTQWDGQHYRLHYGQHQFRVSPSLWLRVQHIDLEVGQQVELLARFGKNDPGIFRIADILYEPEESQIEFFLMHDELIIKRSFRREDLRPLRVQHHLRSGFYQHQPPKSKMPQDAESLDVGDITE